MKSEANADLEAFAKEREVKQEANSSKNRMEEQTLVEQIEGELEEGALEDPGEADLGALERLRELVRRQQHHAVVAPRREVADDLPDGM